MHHLFRTMEQRYERKCDIESLEKNEIETFVKYHHFLFSEVFHEMVRFARRLTAEEAYELGMVSKLVEDYPELVKEAVATVRELKGRVERIPEGPVEIAELKPNKNSLPEFKF